MPQTATSIRLARRPSGEPVPDDFRIETGELPEPRKGEVAIRVLWLSLDPYMRGRMDDAASYAEPVQIGQTMTGQTVGQVIASRADGYAEGDFVTGMTGWTDHAVMSGRELRKLDPDAAPVQTALGVLGMPGLTAWVGLDRIIGIAKGQTVAVSAVTGAVGSVAAQVAAARGCSVVGIAGGSDKCRHAEENLGVRTCVDHRAHSDGKAMAAALKEAAPDGIDGYFENVGGKTLSGIVPNLNQGARVALCGMVAWYSGDNTEHAMPLPALWRRILVKRLRVQGFIVSDHFDLFNDFVSEVAPLVSSGRLHYREDVTDGLEAAPETFIGMLKGKNFGKTLIRVAEA